MERDWVKVYSSNQLHTVELLRHLLHENDIDSILLNQQDSIYVSIGEIHLMVKRNDILRTKRIIEDSGL